MKQEYKIIKDPKPLSPEQIDKHKDFSKLLVNYQKVHRFGNITRPFYRNLGLMSIMVLVGVLVLVMVFDKEEETPAESESTIIQTPSDSQSTNVSPQNIPSDSIKSSIKSNTEVHSQVSQEPTWKYIVEFDADKNLACQFENGVRILIDANTTLDKAGNKAKGRLELLYRETNDQASALSASDTAEAHYQFEYRIREKKTKAWVDLANAAYLEIPLFIKNKASVLYWNKAQEKWTKHAHENKILFPVQSGIPEYAVLTRHWWEFSFSDYSAVASANRTLGKEWRSFQWKINPSVQLKSDKNTELFGAKPARVFASADAQQKFEETMKACFAKKENDTCAGNTMTFWNKSKRASKLSAISIGVSTLNTGIFYIGYEQGNTAVVDRVLQLVPYPADTRVKPGDEDTH